MLVLLSPFPFPPSSYPVEEALGHAGKMRSWEKICFRNWKTQVLIVTTHTVSTGTLSALGCSKQFVTLFKKDIYLFIWLCWIFTEVHRLSSYGVQVNSCGPWTAGYAGIKPHGLQKLWHAGSLIVECRLSVAPWHVGFQFSSLPRDRTNVPWIARQILNHWTSREVPSLSLLRGSEQEVSYESKVEFP